MCVLNPFSLQQTADANVVMSRVQAFLPQMQAENERLQQRVAQLRAQSQVLDGTSAGEGFYASSDSFGSSGDGPPARPPSS